MSDFKLFGTCEMCGKKRFFIKKVKMNLPHSKETMTSKKKACAKCRKNVKLMIQPNK